MTARFKLMITITTIITLTVMIVCRPLAHSAEAVNSLLSIRSYQTQHDLRIVADVLGQPSVRPAMQFNQLHSYELSNTVSKTQQVLIARSALQSWSITQDQNHNTVIEFKFDRPVQLQRQFWLRPDGITRTGRMVWDFKILR